MNPPLVFKFPTNDSENHCSTKHGRGSDPPILPCSPLAGQWLAVTREGKVGMKPKRGGLPAGQLISGIAQEKMPSSILLMRDGTSNGDIRHGRDRAATHSPFGLTRSEQVPWQDEFESGD